MTGKRIIIYLNSGKEVEMEVQTDIRADAFIDALYASLTPGGKNPGFIRSVNPISLICGSATLEQFGLRDGSVLYMD
ncbi:MAG: hypothetical protein J5472_09055 [Clostridia bacterium]|nr:hypothetical protein [Clostridia bacterium]MCR4886545.1 hypothetical protein [Clostridiales bacterium]